MRVVNLFRTEQEDDYDEIDCVVDIDEVPIPKYCWKRRLTNSPKKLQQFKPSWGQTLSFAKLGIRMWNYKNEQKSLGKASYMDPFSGQYPSANGGVPLGGLGSTSITKGYLGDFFAYQQSPGHPSFTPVPANQFSIRIAGEDGVSFATVLNPRDPPSNCLQAFNFGLSGDGCYYCALFPRAWTVYEDLKHGIIVIQEQISPVVAHNYKESSYPVAVFAFTISNSSDEDVEVSLMFSHQSGVGTDQDKQGGAFNIPVSAPISGDANIRGVDMHSKITRTVIDKQTKIKKEMSDESIISIAVLDDGSGEVSHKTSWRTDMDGSDLWEEFAKAGDLGSDESESSRSAPGTTIGAAVCSRVVVAGHSTKRVVFSLSWFVPVFRFGDGRPYLPYYHRFISQDDEFSPSMNFAKEGLLNYNMWQEMIEDWQQPILCDEDLPDWYKHAIFNELYYIVAGGSVWLDKEIEDEEKSKGKSKEEIGNDEGLQENVFFGEDRDFGHFLYLEGQEYLMYNTYDVHYYASFALAQCWPELEFSIINDFAIASQIEQKEIRFTLAYGEYWPRKIKGSIPHDLGGPPEDPYHKLNIYNIQHTCHWKDLNSKFVLQVYRDYLVNKDIDFLTKMKPYVESALKYLSQHFDKNDTGMIENEGFPDQTYDVWYASGVSAYSGGLWLAALGVAVEIGKIVGDEEFSEYWGEKQKLGAKVYEEALWDEEGGYYKYDCANNRHSSSIMADMLCGHWFIKACGLPPFLPEERVKSCLTKIFEMNVERFSQLAQPHLPRRKQGKNQLIGAVNGMLPNGKIDTTALQSSEVWTGTSYALAANLLQEGMVEEAFATAYGVYDSAYNRFGYFFQTPEAWNQYGHYRSISYMRPLAIWAIQWAWERVKSKTISSEKSKSSNQ